MKILTLFILLLGASGVAADANLDALLRQPIEERTREFKRRGPKALAYLKEMAFKRDVGINLRWRAVTTMGRISPIEFRKDIEKALLSPDWYVRNAGLIAVRNDERRQVIQWSTRMLKDSALIVRTQAVRNLIDFNAREAEPILWSMLQDSKNFRGHESLWIRAHLAEAVAKFAGPGRAQQFHRLMLDSDERMHKWAILGIEKATGITLSDRKEPVEIRRQKWLARLGGQSI